jgi:glycosyltransferase involved in cell wall biosynthesis
VTALRPDPWKDANPHIMRLIRLSKKALRQPLWLAAAVMPLAPLLALPFGGGAEAMLALAAAALVPLGALTAVTVWHTAKRLREQIASPALVPAMRAGTTRLPRPRQRELDRWRARLDGGWALSAGAELQSAADDGQRHAEYRVRALTALAEHEAAKRLERPSRHHDLDIVIVSTMNLLGGTTSANEAEILAYRNAGLRVGVVHHPVYDRALDRPVHQRIRSLIDDERVVEVRPHDSARCDLLIVRFPIAFERLMDELPEIDAARSVLLVNQTPHEEYGAAGGYGTSWSIRDVHANLDSWIGPHTWYAIGPAVRDVLRTHHAEDMRDIDLAADFWYETIDLAEWTPATRRVRGPHDPIRVGRHSRDHVTKFPNMAKRLLDAYPARDDIEIHVLGGEQALRRILGGPPAGWVSHPFGEIAPVEFLGGIDVHSYFIDEQYIEAFGRSPLEAMAAQVPCILPPSFAELFGEGALYCEPDEVEALVRKIADDPAYRAARVEAGLRVIEERFSPAALIRRVKGLGVTGGPRTAETDTEQIVSAAQ